MRAFAPAIGLVLLLGCEGSAPQAVPATPTPAPAEEPPAAARAPLAALEQPEGARPSPAGTAPASAEARRDCWSARGGGDEEVSLCRVVHEQGRVLGERLRAERGVLRLDGGGAATEIPYERVSEEGAAGSLYVELQSGTGERVALLQLRGECPAACLLSATVAREGEALSLRGHDPCRCPGDDGQ